MKKHTLILALFLSVYTISGCKKEELKNDKPGLLVGKKWKATSLSENGKEVYMNEPLCTMDDYIVFAPNNLYKLDEGSTKCDSNDPQVKDVGAWSIDGDVLYMQSDELPVKSSVNIKELTATKMVLNQTNIYNNTVDITTYIAE